MNETETKTESIKTELTDKLHELTSKYKYTGNQPERTQADEILDSPNKYKQSKDLVERVSKAPTADKADKDGEEMSIGTIHKLYAGIQMDLVELNEQYDTLGVQFKDLVKGDPIYNRGESLKLWWYGYNKKQQGKAIKPANHKKIREIQLNAVERKGNCISEMVDKMAEVLNEGHEKAKQGITYSQELLTQNVYRTKNLQKKLIECLRGSQYTDANLLEAQQEVTQFENEIKETESLLEQYENKIKDARARGSLEQVLSLTDEMSEVLEIQHGLMDGTIGAEGKVSDIRRYLLDMTEGVQSSKGAIAKAKVNYRLISALIDSMNELEIKYRHAKEDMIPEFRESGKISNIGLQALDMKEIILRIADKSQDLMDANVKMALYLASQTFELIKTPTYNMDRIKADEAKARKALQELNQQKLEWIRNSQTLQPISYAPHDAAQQ